jgi:hypothetical protein
MTLPFRAATCAALTLCCAARAYGQQSERGSRYIETSHWAYEYLGRLRARGYLRGLDPMLQPYHRADIVRALSGLSPDSLPRPAAQWVRLLKAEFGGEEPQWGAVVMGGTRAANNDHLDLVHPLGTGDIWPNGTVGAWFEGGHVAAESRVLMDLYVQEDPELRHPRAPLGGVADHSYLLVAVPYAGVMLGRLAHNWGLPGRPGLMVSDQPLAYPQLGFEGRYGRFALQAFTAELDTLAGSRRYLAAQRLGYTSAHFAVAASNAVLYTGPNIAPSLQLLNPLALLAYEQENPPGDDRQQNYQVSLQAWYRAKDLVLHGEFLLDRIDMHRKLWYSKAPTQYAYTAGARLSGLAPWLEVSADYEQASSYVYRSFGAGDRWDYLGRGLGLNFADHDQWTFAVDLFPEVPGLRLTPTYVAARQGEGDFREPMPTDSVFRLSPTLLLGTPEKVSRVALRGRYQPTRHFWVNWDVGPNTVRNLGHGPGIRDSKFVMLGQVGLRLDVGPRRR